jgi:hypothetical protein
MLSWNWPHCAERILEKNNGKNWLKVKKVKIYYFLTASSNHLQTAEILEDQASA